MTALHKLTAQADTPPHETRWSALFDGELDDEAARLLLREVAANPARSERFGEYCRIGDALRGLAHEAPLRTRVMAALEREPTLLAPAPKAATTTRQPVLWLAAATVAAITWGLWSMSPQQEDAARMAAREEARPLQASPDDGGMAPYLAAHQDFAQAVVAPSEMHFTRVTLAEADR